MAGRRVWNEELPNTYKDRHGGRCVERQPDPAQCKIEELRFLDWPKKFVHFYKKPSNGAEMSWEAVRDWCTAFHVFTDVPEELREHLRGVYVLKQCSCKTFRHYYICAHVRVMYVGHNYIGHPYTP